MHLPAARHSRVLLAAGLLGALLLPALALALDVTRFNGSATDIGIQRGPGQVGGVEYRIRGEFDYDGPLDLTTSVATWDSLLAEVGSGGAGELIKTIDDAPVVPIVLARKRAGANDALYETQRYRPQMRFQLRRRGTHYEFRLKLDRGLARTVPHLCSGDPAGQKSSFLHHFTIDDGVNPALDVATVQIWDCSNLEGFQLKARQLDVPTPSGTPSPGSTPRPTVPPATGDGTPSASLRVNAITRNSSEPDLFELDGSGSSDSNGAIVRYRFDSGDGRVIDGTASKITLTYPPGDYFAILTVFDAQGNSASAGRSFSDK
jgi:hypothetical protein